MAASTRRELVEALGMLALVVAAAALGLKGLDGLARLAQPPAAPPRYASVGELEQATRERLALPTYFPDTLSWPPASIRTAAGRGPPRAVVLGFRTREGGAERLLVGQSLGGAGAIPAELLPEGVVLETHAVRVGEAPATLERVLGADGASWYALRWQAQGRTLALHTRGSRTELLRMAESMHAGRRR